MDQPLFSGLRSQTSLSIAAGCSSQVGGSLHRLLQPLEDAAPHSREIYNHRGAFTHQSQGTYDFADLRVLFGRFIAEARRIVKVNQSRDIHGVLIRKIRCTQEACQCPPRWMRVRTGFEKVKAHGTSTRFSRFDTCLHQGNNEGDPNKITQRIRAPAVLVVL